MAYIETSIYIDVSPEELFEYAEDPQQIAEWFEGVESVQADENYPELGAKIAVTYKAAGLTLKTTGTVAQLEEAKIIQIDYEGMASGLQTWTYQAEGNGTRLTLTFDYQISGGGFGKMMDKLIVERQNKANFEKSLQNLKQLVEEA